MSQTRQVLLSSMETNQLLLSPWGSYKLPIVLKPPPRWLPLPISWLLIYEMSPLSARISPCQGLGKAQGKNLGVFCHESLADSFISPQSCKYHNQLSRNMILTMTASRLERKSKKKVLCHSKEVSKVTRTFPPEECLIQ